MMCENDTPAAFPGPGPSEMTLSKKRGANMELSGKGVYLINGTEAVPEGADAEARICRMTGEKPDKAQARKETIAWSILHAHN